MKNSYICKLRLTTAKPQSLDWPQLCVVSVCRRLSGWSVAGDGRYIECHNKVTCIHHCHSHEDSFSVSPVRNRRRRRQLVIQSNISHYAQHFLYEYNTQVYDNKLCVLYAPNVGHGRRWNWYISENCVWHFSVMWWDGFPDSRRKHTQTQNVCLALWLAGGVALCVCVIFARSSAGFDSQPCFTRVIFASMPDTKYIIMNAPCERFTFASSVLCVLPINSCSRHNNINIIRVDRLYANGWGRAHRLSSLPLPVSVTTRFCDSRYIYRQWRNRLCFTLHILTENVVVFWRKQTKKKTKTRRSLNSVWARRFFVTLERTVTHIHAIVCTCAHFVITTSAYLFRVYTYNIYIIHINIIWNFAKDIHGHVDSLGGSATSLLLLLRCRYIGSSQSLSLSVCITDILSTDFNGWRSRRCLTRRVFDSNSMFWRHRNAGDPNQLVTLVYVRIISMT